MKKLLFLLFAWSSLTFATTEFAGVAVFDVEEYRPLNTWIRNHMVEIFLDSNITILDTLFTTNENQIVSFVRDGLGQYKFVFLNITGASDDYSAVVEKEVPLDATDFRVDVLLEERQLVLTDRSEHNIKLIFPIAHGGLNIDNTQISTPAFEAAYLDRQTVISQRTKPSYYQGLPFLRVMTDKEISKGWTGIGIHIKQNSNLKRNPDSHGCIRLRKWDLMTIHSIIKKRNRRYTDLSIKLRDTESRFDVTHPYSFLNTSFQKVKNFGTPQNPIKRRDSHGLTVFERVYENPVPYIEAMDYVSSREED